MQKLRRPALIALFAASGFAGLIYESIWTHYLKLFLGHAAYAQTLVLAIFMGGMAIGSWAAARQGARVRNLLAAYAVTEAAIGVARAGVPRGLRRRHRLGLRLFAAALRRLQVVARGRADPSPVRALGNDLPADDRGASAPVSRPAGALGRAALLHQQPGRRGRRARQRVLALAGGRVFPERCAARAPSTSASQPRCGRSPARASPRLRRGRPGRRPSRPRLLALPRGGADHRRLLLRLRGGLDAHAHAGARRPPPTPSS